MKNLTFTNAKTKMWGFGLLIMSTLMLGSMSVSAQSTSCGCNQINVTLNSSCQFTLTPAQVSNGSCDGTNSYVVVQDGDPSNRDAIDCAGLFTYGLFDSSNDKLICWGKVLAEDKTAPVITAAPSGAKFLCTEVTAVLNNPKTVGTYAAGNGKVGNASATDNCGGKCACQQPTIINGRLKFSDRVVYYNCPQGTQWGTEFKTATIFRTWSATDCSGNTSTLVQAIDFYRPAVTSLSQSPSFTQFSFKNDGVLQTNSTGVTPLSYTEGTTPQASGDYDAVTSYNSCTPDQSKILENDWLPFIKSNLTGNEVYISTIDCYYSIDTPADVTFPVCNGKGIKIDRSVVLFDWCAGTKDKIAHTLIKITDLAAPTIAFGPKQIGTSTNAPLPITLSTGPMDCTASFLGTAAGLKAAFDVTIADNCALASVATKVATYGKIVYGIVVDNSTLYPVDYKVVNGYTIGLPVGHHVMTVDAYDGCYNQNTFKFDFYVVDRIAPVMKCNDQLTVTLSNTNGYDVGVGTVNGYAIVTALEIDRGSWDNCKMDSLKVRRAVPKSLYDSFIAKGYDTNGNGKLDTLDGFDYNGNGKLEPAIMETFRNKNGFLMTPLQPFVEFFCLDAGTLVRTELWGRDGKLIITTTNDPNANKYPGDIVSGGNFNFCWQDILVEDKVAPTIMAPLDVTIDCLSKGMTLLSDNSKTNRILSSAQLGDVTVMSGADCGNLDTAYTVTPDLKCGYGKITRTWTLTKKTVKGPLATTVSQTVTVNAVHQYNICFPKDASIICRTENKGGTKTPTLKDTKVDSVVTKELGCDILAVNVTDKRYSASDDECYKIFRTYNVINWCTYVDQCTNSYTVDRANSNYGAKQICVLARNANYLPDGEYSSASTGVTSYYLSSDEKLDKNDISINPSGYTCKDPRDKTDYISNWFYTQIIKVYDDERPLVKQPKLSPYCIATTAPCLATVTINFKATDNCSSTISVESNLIKIAPGQTPNLGECLSPTVFDKTWTAGRVGTISDSFTVTVKNLPEGTHDLIVVVRDECGNLSVPTRIPFTVKDCKAPVPICINGLSTDLMPDGNKGGAMTVWARDFIASPIYDCNGQGIPDPLRGDGQAEKDGLKLITKYSINRYGQPKDVKATGLTVTCADKGKQITVEIHAWDEKGNDDYCLTFLEVQDNNKVCPASAAGSETVAGAIVTEGNVKVEGVDVSLSGSATSTIKTTANGAYQFSAVVKGGDYTVTPRLNRNNLNGVSTFDLVLISKHILGVTPLGSPFKMIAADINNSKSITTLDLIQLRKLILNIDTEFSNNTSWRFVDASYRFPVSSNPWAETFPEVKNFNNLAGTASADFVAVKIGDVNGTASANSATGAEARSATGTLELNTTEQALKAGNEYTVVFTAADMAKIQGYQFAMNFDRSAVELVDMAYGVAKAENFGVFATQGLITASWNGAANSDELFSLVIRAKKNADLSSVLSLNARALHGEAYGNDVSTMNVALKFNSLKASAASFELLQNTPNPFNNETVIGFNLPEAVKATLKIQDVTGRTLKVIKGDFAKGYNQVVLKGNELNTTGVLYYTLDAANFTATKKMVIVE